MTFGRLASQAWSVARYELMRLRRARLAVLRFGVLAIPFGVALLVAGTRFAFGHRDPTGALVMLDRVVPIEDEIRKLAMGFRAFDLRILILLSAAGLFGGLFSGERADRTLHHVFLQPVRRDALTAGKFVGAVLLLWIGSSVAWLATMLTWLLPHGAGPALQAVFWGRGLADTLGYMLVLLLATAAYGGVFVAAGAVTKSPSIVALVLMGWEALCSFLPLAFQRLTVFYWLDSLLPIRMPFASALSVLADRAPWPLAVLTCLLIGAAGVAGAAWRARTLEVSYGASE